ncbi:uncharacterized protein LOC121599956 [Anopheles merus]|uniref:uncharacterized protein LOC121599956 n=1 Tax=Anopheles merus TaxID=30066 RepID=UPI001BE4BF6E|nr:uncharacterized protein LOC121599956 [Anopheles merus]
MCCKMEWFPLLLGLLCIISETRGQENHLPCGKRTVTTEYLIHDGMDTKAGFWPWHVAIFHEQTGKMHYKCGGSIIDESTILTASHCVYTQSGVISISRVSVDVGRIYLNESSEYTQTHRVREIIVHPGFSKNSIVNDIALIKLITNITINKYVQPVCLWTMDSNQELIVGKNGTIVGFGYNEQDILSDQLKQALIGVEDTFSCIADDRGVFGTHLTSDMFCGKGRKGVSACNGDSGGGMFFEIGGKWFVRGLVSFTPARLSTALCDPLKNTAYTDVAKYLEWIKPYIDQRVLSYRSDLFDVDYVEKLRLFNFQTCGLKSPVYGKNGTGWTLPWIGLVIPPGGGSHKCIVTLISDWYAVGPAHCFENDGVKSTVVLGFAFESSSIECFESHGSAVCTHPVQMRKIQRIIVHPKFNINNSTDNIALIELLSPADTTQPNVKPICLPVTAELRTREPSSLSVPTKFGRTIELKSIPVRYLEAAECMRQYTQRQIVLELGNKWICAELVNKQDSLTCRALEAGAPLQETKTFNGTERHFLWGFELHGSACNVHPPPVYIDIEAYLDWILYNMRYNVLETTDSDKITITKELLGSEWSKLRQQPGKERLRLFNMDTCGIVSPHYQVNNALPWIGYLKVAENTTGDFPSTRSLVVLISEWYALAPKRSVQNGVTWRHLILGKHTGADPCFPTKCELSHQLVEINNIIIPPPNHPRQTFALIELLEPANLLNPYIRPICLPFMKQLHRRKPTEAIISSSQWNSIIGKQLTIIDQRNCQQRMLLKNRFVPLEENSMCAIETDNFAKFPLHSILGSPLQVPIPYGESSRIFLYGMDNNEPHRFANLNNGPYLFHTIELADLEWIVANVRDKAHQSSFLATTRNERVNLMPVQQAAKPTLEALLEFNSCGESSSSYPTPWVGNVLSNVTFSSARPCSVTLVNHRHVVGPAYCFEDASQQYSVEFGYANSDTVEKQCFKTNKYEACDLPTQRVAIERIHIHPQYNRTNHAHDLALALLSTSVDTTLPNVRPICLPTIDSARSYDTSNLVQTVIGFSSTFNFGISSVDDRYITSPECQSRWQGLKVNFSVDRSKHCVISKRALNDECVYTDFGGSLHSLQWLESKQRHFLRGFAAILPRACSIYYPVVYTNIDVYLDWILEAMKESANLPFDLREIHIFSNK